MNVLVVEDDVRITSFLVKGLKAEGYSISVASDGDVATETIESVGPDFDIVLLDLALPGTDGWRLLDLMRARHPAIPVIILTARDDLTAKVRGLDRGANDYITKPFAFEELLSRMRAALRAHDQASAHELVVGDLRLDLLSKVAWRAGRRIELSVRECSLLEFFMRHPTQVVSRAQILNHVWDLSFDPGSNVVDVYVGYLRRKLNRPELDPTLQAVRGAGYRLLKGGSDG